MRPASSEGYKYLRSANDMKSSTIIICALMLGCSSEAPPLACQTQDHVFAAIARSVDGGTSKVVWMAGETQGWAFSNVGANATIRRKGFVDGDLLARVCGLTIDEFINVQGDICCKGLVLSFRGANRNYEITLEPDAQQGAPADPPRPAGSAHP
jgi:hypothetical protein